ncbi:N-acetyltransferase [Paenibacillus terrigena]|uniref:N-acetyltransferase n=1 Tax=Paenibacillus terrigena TaxID=369333 RepID=UPI0028D4E2A8|nr:N-acetyltransferase [Paenibacillus terrigena]
MSNNGIGSPYQNHKLISQTAVVGDSVVVGEGIQIGHFCVIGDEVVIGNHVTLGHGVIIGKGVTLGSSVRIGNHVCIEEGASIGEGVTIMDHAVVGKQPFRAKRSILASHGQLEPAVLEDGSTLGTSSIVYAGARLGPHVFVADLATVRERVQIGYGTIIGRGASIENDCEIGQRCKIETNAYLTAYSHVEDDVFIAPGVITSNDNFMGRTAERFKYMKGITIKQGGRLGAGVVTLPGVIVQREGTAAAGSVVTKDIEQQQLVMGAPARILREVPEAQLLKSQ